MTLNSELLYSILEQRKPKKPKGINIGMYCHIKCILNWIRSLKLIIQFKEFYNMIICIDLSCTIY